jgi:hypothetical protein
MYSSRQYIPVLFIISYKTRSVVRMLHMKHIADINFICVIEKRKSKEIHKK